MEPTLNTFSDLQMEWLAIRHKHRSDAQAARAMDLQPKSVNAWKRNTPGFREAAEQAIEHRRQEQEALATFDRDKFIEENLLDAALRRLHEIVSIHINDDTDAATIAQVRQAATTILHDRGVLADDEADPQRATVVIQQYIDEGQAYRPSWRVVQEPDSTS